MQTFQYVRRQNIQENLIDFVCKRFPYLNREQWLENIENTCLLLNSEKVPPQTVLKTGDKIGYLRPIELEPPINKEIELFYEDSDLLLVNKNGNIPVSPSGKYYYNTLYHLLKEDFQYKEIYPVHRLDRETSGLVLFAKNLEATQKLGDSFLKGQPQKLYHALLIGETGCPQTKEVKAPMMKNKEKSKIFIRQVIDPKGKSAHTCFDFIWSQKGLSFTKIELFTGRTHQIRCHAEFIGFPVLGDKLYGQSDEDFLTFVKTNKNPELDGLGEIPRQMLHASYLSIEHPSKQKKMEWFAPPQKEFQKIKSLAGLF